MTRPRPSSRNFVDLFAGCGGLSLGLTFSGMQGMFAIEKSEMAFETFAANFLESERTSFDWPEWLEKGAWAIDRFLDIHGKEIASLRGTVDIVAGGPPCQGFSFAGRRNGDDPRNLLFREYVRVIELIRPRVLLMENVPGMAVAHVKVGSKGQEREASSFLHILKEQLERLDYSVEFRVLDAAHFLVPQRRSRLILVGLCRDDADAIGGAAHVFSLLERNRVDRIRATGIEAVTVADAISDLSQYKRELKPCVDPRSPPSFQEIVYKGPVTKYQEWMNQDVEPDDMDSMRQKLQDAVGRPMILTDWRQRNRSFFEALKIERTVMFLILTLIVLVAALNIVSGLTMLVKDKGRDIAILRTMGATRGSIMRVFLLTGSAIGFTGTFAGVLIGLVIAHNLEAFRQFINRSFGVNAFDPNFYLLSRLPSVVVPADVAFITLLALGLSLLATIYPSWRAARLDPVEALRYE